MSPFAREHARSRTSRGPGVSPQSQLIAKKPQLGCSGSMAQSAQTESSLVGAPPVGGWMTCVAQADPRLAPFVAETSFYAELGTGRRHHHHLPSPSLTIIINLQGAFASLDSAGALNTTGECDGFLAGLQMTPAETVIEGPNSGIEICLTPLGASLLGGGLPLHELRDDSVPLVDLGSAFPPLLRRLGAHPTLRGKLELVRHFLLAHFQHAEVDRSFPYAWDRLRSTGGLLPIRELARELGWSQKRLVREFRQFAGLGPKEAARLFRFDRAVGWMQNQERSWTEIAVGCGFHDQPHLAREIRAFSGSSPSELRARIHPALPLPEGGNPQA